MNAEQHLDCVLSASAYMSFWLSVLECYVPILMLVPFLCPAPVPLTAACLNSASPLPAAACCYLLHQLRAEFLDMTLAGLCFVAPEIEQRLRQVGPNKGRAGVGQVQGSSQVFALAEGLPDGAKKVSSSPGNTSL